MKNIVYYSCVVMIGFSVFFTTTVFALVDTMFWWQPYEGGNFGDELSRVIVEKMLGRQVKNLPWDTQEKKLLAAGSIVQFARDGDVIWGSGFRGDPIPENNFHRLDVRAVRGPKTREFLLKRRIKCPAVYGDPALLMSYLFPEFKTKKPILDYIIIPNIGEISCFTSYKNVVVPTLPWRKIVQKITQSRLVISSSLHGIIVAESFGIPARLLKMTWVEPLFKYQDYYESTGRKHFRYATSVQDALKWGGEKPGFIDLKPLLDSFPCDYFNTPSNVRKGCKAVCVGRHFPEDEVLRNQSISLDKNQTSNS